MSGIAICPPSTLYDRMETIADLLDALDSPGHTQHQINELAAALTDAIFGSKEKIDAIGRALATWESQADLAKDEIARITKRRRALEARGQNLRDHVLLTMDLMQTRKLEGLTSSITTRRNAPSLHIWDQSQIPIEFMRHGEPEPDATQIKAVLQQRKDIAARLAEEIPAAERADLDRLVATLPACPGATLIESRSVVRG